LRISGFRAGRTWKGLADELSRIALLLAGRRSFSSLSSNGYVIGGEAPLPQLQFDPSPDRRQFGGTHTPNSRVGHAAQRGKEVFRPLLDVPAPPQAGDDVPPLPAVPELTPHDGQEFEDRRIIEDNGDAH
jgi:hypothetical protein